VKGAAPGGGFFSFGNNKKSFLGVIKKDRTVHRGTFVGSGEKRREEKKVNESCRNSEFLLTSGEIGQKTGKALKGNTKREPGHSREPRRAQEMKRS